MRISRLELENWMGIQQLKMDFSPGINLVYGRNEIGKSSIIESIRHAILGDASSKKAEYRTLKPWGSKDKALVKLFFTAKGDNYHIYKSFPGGNTGLYRKNVRVTEDPRITREKLFQILDISEKTTNLFHLLFINQGESLDIFDKKGKENPLDENTKSYIKEVIKETAFREIQDFQDYIGKELKNYLTPSRKDISSKAKYKEFLNKEKELAEKLEELKQEEEQHLGKISEIEKNDREIHRLQKEVLDKEEFLEALKKKKARLYDFEKKELAFKPIKNDYDQYTEIVSALEEIRGRLPELLAARQDRITNKKKHLEDLEQEKTQSLETLDKLKRKKQEGENIQLLSRDFEKIKADYDDLLKMENQVRDIQATFPQIVATGIYLQENQLNKISERLKLRSHTAEEISRLESQLKEFPEITRKEIDALRKLENQVNRLHDRIASSREELRLNFRLIPLEEKKIPYTIETDNDEPKTGTAIEPLDISGFQKLRFNYAKHLDIHVAGNLGKSDFNAMQNELSSAQEQLKEKLEHFNVETIDQLEGKYGEFNEIKNKRENIKTKLDTFEKQEEFENQKKEIIDTIESLKEDFRKYVGEELLPDVAPPGEEIEQHTIRRINQQLSTAKANLDSFQERKELILAKHQYTFPELEKEFKQQEKELQKQTELYRALEPGDIDTVTDNHLEKAASITNDIDKKIVACKSEIDLLEEMEPLAMEPGSHEVPPSYTALTAQQLRDDIRQSMNRRTDLERKQQELLRQMSEKEFKMNYMRMKDELESLQKELKDIPPLQFNDSTLVEEEIQKTEIEIKNTNLEKGTIEKNRELLIGQTAGYSRVVEDKINREHEYRQVLASIKQEISEIASLKLIDLLIDEEKAKAQQEVFKPLQDRVVSSFSALVGDRYKIEIDNDLNLEVSGRTLTGEYQSEVDGFLSYGTKEQLSFLFRLAIATQLSRKEPGVMVLDDSFVNTDLDRFPLLLDILCAKSPDLQFLVFTCRPSDYLSYFPTWNDKNLRYIDLDGLMAPGKSV
jgi:DNA repair exonuclease SbcCD ATPase subunit